MRYPSGLVACALALLGLALALAGCASGAASGAARPTDTPVTVSLPTSTPIPTPSDPAGQALLGVARAAAGEDALSVGVTYDTPTRHLTVTVTITGSVPDTDASIATAYARVKALTLAVERALWASGQLLSQAQVIVMGPAQDEYGEVTDQWYGIAVLNQPAARRIPWASATPASAWRLYDQTYLRVSFTVADDIITGPVATYTPG
ncbi:MAG TPA: hypothetical protein VF808_01610 [Ktedonobacterales bacterium]